MDLKVQCYTRSHPSTLITYDNQLPGSKIVTILLVLASTSTTITKSLEFSHSRHAVLITGKFLIHVNQSNY